MVENRAPVAAPNTPPAGGKHQPDHLSKLGLAIGDPLILETISPKRKLQARLIGYWVGHSILIAPPTYEGREVNLEQSMQLTVRGMIRNQAFAFSTKVSYRGQQPYRHYHLECPSETASVEIRKNSRIEVDLPVLLDTEVDIGMGDWPKAAVILDLSPKGAGLLSRQMLGEKGHEVIMKLTLEVSGVERSLSLPCVIRNHTVVDRPSGSHYLFGVEFEQLTETAQLTLTGFLYELNSSN